MSQEVFDVPALVLVLWDALVSTGRQASCRARIGSPDAMAIGSRTSRSAFGVGDSQLPVVGCTGAIGCPILDRGDRHPAWRQLPRDGLVDAAPSRIESTGEVAVAGQISYSMDARS